MKGLLTKSLLFGLLLISCHDQTTEIKKQNLPKVAFTSIDKEAELRQALDQIGFNGANSSGRLMSGLSEIKSDSILKVLRRDSLNYTFTIAVGGNQKLGTFKNLVFRRVSKGFFASVVEYVSDQPIVDLKSFTGTVKEYNLEGTLLREFSLLKAKLDSRSGRTAACFADVSTQCAEWFQPNAQYSVVCVKWVTVITIDCTGGSGGGGSGSSGGGSNPLPFSYFPDFGAVGSGGSSGGGGQSGGGGPLFEGLDPVGVLPPTEPSIDEIATAIEDITDPEAKRVAQLNYIKRFDAQEGESFAEMVEEIIRTPGITVGDVIEVNSVVNNFYLNLRGRYMIAVYYSFAKAAQFIVELALIETGTEFLFQSVKAILATRYAIGVTKVVPAVIKTSQELINGIKAELRFGTNQATLDVTIGTRNLTGIGNGNTVYNFSGVSQAEAKAFFDKISGGTAVKVDVPNKGSYWRVGLGESKQMIQYRNFSSTNAGEVTIEFKIESIRGDKVVELKFWP